MNKYILILFLTLAVAILAVPSAAQAQLGSANGGDFGLGIMFGEPTGASIKIWSSSQSAFVVGAAWSLAERSEALHMHADYLQHSWFANTSNLAFYYGLGARIIFASEAELGLRVPLGFNYVFGAIPFDLFVEAVPIAEFSPDFGFAGNGGVGIRYYF